MKVPFYHVMLRGVGGGKIFVADSDYSRFLKYVEITTEKFNVVIYLHLS